MFRPYRHVLAHPGALRFSAAGFVARLPISMLTLGVVLLVSGTGRSYALAGAAAGAVNLGSVLAVPRLARLMDHHGQAAVLRPAAALQVLVIGGLVTAGTEHAPAAVLLGLALLSGMSLPSIGGLVRARWSALLSDPGDLHAAYSLEAVLDEVIFVVGPIVATLLATTVHPAGGVVAVLLVAPTGALALAAQRSTEPAVAGPPARDAVAAALASGGLLVVVGVFTALGALFGAVEVTTVAFTSEQGHRSAAGGVLALYALASMLAGLTFGALRRDAPPRQGFVVGAVALGFSGLALPQVGSVAGLAALAFLAGLAISPTLISGMALVRDLAPATRLTEAFAWATTGLSVGLMLGSAAAGHLAEHSGAADGFWAASVAALAASALAVAGSARLRPAGAVHASP